MTLFSAIHSQIAEAWIASPGMHPNTHALPVHILLMDDPIRCIQDCQEDDERILLAADLAYSRACGMHAGQDILLLYRQREPAENIIADAALAWLKENGARFGVYLRER